MQLERFDPLVASDLTRACHEMYLAGRWVDDPATPAMSLRSFAVELALGWTENPQETWLARDAAGQPSGWYMIVLPERENRWLAHLRMLVSPAARRQGMGTALLRQAAGQAGQRGRTALRCDARCGSPAEAFAAAIGARPGIAEALRVLAVGAIPAGRVGQLRAAAVAKASEYVLLSWPGPVPAGEVAGVMRLYEESNDAPREAGHDGQRWDARRMAEYADRVAAQGLRHYTVAARSRQTGELAALTQLGVDPQVPAWGIQELTVVARAHRGHRLGLLVKAAMLEQLAQREPQLTHILTGNAVANTYMIAINEQLGFRELDHWRSWELSVDDALALPGSVSTPARG